MKHVKVFLKSYSIVLGLVIALLVFFAPVFFGNKTLLSSNFLVGFYHPWALENIPAWPQGVPYKPVGGDDLRIFYPQRSFTQEVLTTFELPFWNPYSFSGNYHLGLSETAVFYPLFSLFSFLPQPTAWLVLMLVQPIIAFGGMYLFLRLLFKEKIHAFFGAVVFGFSGLILVRMVEGLSVGHTLIWLPLALFGIEGYLQKRKMRYVGIALLALLFSVLAGWFQFAFYLILCTFLYSCLKVFVSKERRLSDLLVFLPFLLVPLLTLMHTIPAIETYLLSPRGDADSVTLTNHLMPLTHLFTFFYPDYFGNPATLTFFGKSEYKESIAAIGVLPLLLAVFSLRVRKNWVVFFFWALAILSLILATSNPLSHAFLSLKLPVVSSFLPVRILYLTVVSFSVLAAFGLREFFLIQRKIRMLWIVTLAGFCSLIVFFSHQSLVSFLPIPEFMEKVISPFLGQEGSSQLSLQQLSIQARNVLLGDLLILLSLFFFSLSFVLKKKLIIVGFFGLTCIGQLYFSYKYLPFSQKEFIFPSTDVMSYLEEHAGLNRFISTGTSAFTSEMPLFYRLYSPEGVSSMYPKRYGELVGFAIDPRFTGSIPRIESRIAPDPRALFGSEKASLKRFLQIDGVKYIVVHKRDFSPSAQEFAAMEADWKLVWQKKDWSIYVYQSVLPRYFLTNSYEVIPDDTLLLTRLFDETFDTNTLLLEKDPHIVSGPKTSGRVRLLSYQPNKIVFETESKQAQLLYLSDTYSPNFKSVIDGERVESIRANYVFRAIAVPKGKHTIQMLYLDDFFLVGAMISLILGLVLVTSVVFLQKSKRIVW